MSASLLSYEQLEMKIVELDSSAYDCRVRISIVRRSMDASCDGGVITIRQWRTLLESISVLQSIWTVPYKSEAPNSIRTI